MTSTETRAPDWSARPQQTPQQWLERASEVAAILALLGEVPEPTRYT